MRTGGVWAFVMSSCIHSMISWGVWVLNSPAKRSAVFQLVDSVRPSLVCFQESKLADISRTFVKQYLGNKFETFAYLTVVETHGGIIIARDSSLASLCHTHFMAHTITVQVNPDDGTAWWLIGVYGPQSLADHVEFLRELEEVRDLHAGST